MPFKEVPNKVDFPEQERQLLKFWKETQAFEKREHLHRHDPHWSFIDGPITANNPMGVHHGWGRTYKDLFLRFQTMRGQKLRYQNGFDCQGLWVEVEVEKEMGFTTKKDIEEFGLEQFVRKCKARVLRYRRRTNRAIHPIGLLDGLERSRSTALVSRPNVGRPRPGDHRSGTRWSYHRHRRADRRSPGSARAGRQLFHLLQRKQLHDLDLLEEMLAEGLAVPRGGCDALVSTLRHGHQPA